jgi:hypothetical protein
MILSTSYSMMLPNMKVVDCEMMKMEARSCTTQNTNPLCPFSAVSAEGKRSSNKLDSILLNGNGIAMLVPGSSPEDAAATYVGPKPG